MTVWRRFSIFIIKRRATIMIVIAIAGLILIERELIESSFRILDKLNANNYSLQIPIAQFTISIATLFCLNATILYSLYQFTANQKRNRIQDFEKNFYNRINYLDNVVLNEIEFSSAKLSTDLKPAGRRAFLYFNEIFRHYHCHFALNEGVKHSAEDYDASTDKTKFMEELSVLYNKHFIDHNGKEIFGFYIRYFV